MLLVTFKALYRELASDVEQYEWMQKLLGLSFSLTKHIMNYKWLLFLSLGESS